MGVVPKLLVSVSGRDKHGITAELCEILTMHKVQLLDIEQVVIKGRLHLYMLLQLEEFTKRGERVLKELLVGANKYSLKLEIVAREKKDLLCAGESYVATMLGSPLNADSLHRFSKILSYNNISIDSIKTLDDRDLSTLEIAMELKSGQDALGLRRQLMSSLSGLGVDIALQREALCRRNKRLVALDMDSTLIGVEVIDKLGMLAGVSKEISQLTTAAMLGQIDFKDSLNKLALLPKTILSFKLSYGGQMPALQLQNIIYK